MRLGSYLGKIVPFQYYSKYKGNRDATVIFKDSDSNVILPNHSSVQTLSDINCPKNFAVFVYDSNVMVSKRVSKSSYFIWNITTGDITGLYESQVKSYNPSRELYSIDTVAGMMQKSDIIICIGEDFGIDATGYKSTTYYTYDDMIRMMEDDSNLMFGNSNWGDNVRVVTITVMGNNVIGLMKIDTGKIKSWKPSDESKSSDQYYIV